jgi:hypothetical protein
VTLLGSTRRPRITANGHDLPTLTEPQMSALSCIYHTDGQLWLGGSFTRPAARLVALGYAECVEERWHRVTPAGAEAFVRMVALKDTREGAAARRILERAA